MTIGPLPIRQIDSRSLRRGTELLDEVADDRPGVVRTRPGFGMELRGPRMLLREIEPFDGAVVERNVRRLALLGSLDGEAVVLRRDEHAPGRTLEHRMVRAAMPERQLVRLHPGDPEPLVDEVAVVQELLGRVPILGNER